MSLFLLEIYCQNYKTERRRVHLHSILSQRDCHIEKDTCLVETFCGDEFAPGPVKPIQPGQSPEQAAQRLEVTWFNLLSEAVEAHEVVFAQGRWLVCCLGSSAACLFAFVTMVQGAPSARTPWREAAISTSSVP
jgi:hypothetical protein